MEEGWDKVVPKSKKGKLEKKERTNRDEGDEEERKNKTKEKGKTIERKKGAKAIPEFFKTIFPEKPIEKLVYLLTISVKN